MNHAHREISLPTLYSILGNLERGFEMNRNANRNHDKWLVASLLFENRVNMSTHVPGDPRTRGGVTWFDGPLALEIILPEIVNDDLAVIMSDWVWQYHLRGIDFVSVLWEWYGMPQGC